MIRQRFRYVTNSKMMRLVDGNTLNLIEPGQFPKLLADLLNLMNKAIVLIAAGLLSVVPAQARWAGGCGSYGNPPCSLCRELKAEAPLETQCVWGANRRTTFREYLQLRLDDE